MNTLTYKIDKNSDIGKRIKVVVDKEDRFKTMLRDLCSEIGARPFIAGSGGSITVSVKAFEFDFNKEPDSGFKVYNKNMNLYYPDPQTFYGRKIKKAIERIGSIKTDEIDCILENYKFNNHIDNSDVVDGGEFFIIKSKSDLGEKLIKYLDLSKA